MILMRTSKLIKYLERYDIGVDIVEFINHLNQRERNESNRGSVCERLRLAAAWLASAPIGLPAARAPHTGAISGQVAILPAPPARGPALAFVRRAAGCWLARWAYWRFRPSTSLGANSRYRQRAGPMAAGT